MNYWVLADTHFGHEKLGGAYGWPSDFAEKIIKQVSLIVQPRDILIHLGDVCFYTEGYWHNLLRASCLGKMWLIRGNHDKRSYSWYIDKGWDFVAESVRLEIFGSNLLLTHKPNESWCESVDTKIINIHGHLHLKEANHPWQKVVATERTLRPINLRKIAESREQYF